jgi:hypothetical protein
MVAFIDPRHSRIDIAQATGRAMRKPPGSNKEVGYVVVPLFLERRSGETLDEAFEQSDFSDVADVLNAMREEDEDLVQIICAMQEAKGRGEPFDPKRLSERIEVIGPSIELSSLRSNIFAEIVNTIGVSWDEMFGRLLLFRDAHQHCRVPSTYKDKKLAKWVSHQRNFANNAKLSTIRKQRLDDIGFSWDLLDANWENGFRSLIAYKHREGHCCVPDTRKENGFRLGQWVRVQRENRDTMSTLRRRRLDEIGFVWDAKDWAWKEALRHLEDFKQREGNCLVPVRHKENGYPLGNWVVNQRQNKDGLSDERRRALDALGFVWEVPEATWEVGFSYLQMFKEREGHCRVPPKHKEKSGFRLGAWVDRQRQARHILSEVRRQRLNDIGFVWDPFEADWEEGFRNLQIYREREGHCRVPQSHEENGYRLGTWVNVQRQKRDSLPKVRLQRLNDIGFVWDPYEADWEEGFRNLQIYREREGHCRVPHTHKENRFSLGGWVSRQRSRKDTLTKERLQRLDELGFVWDPFEKAWERAFNFLKIYKEREGHCRVPIHHKENGFNLGHWAHNQRRLKAEMPIGRRECLDALGFVWNERDSAQ